MNLVDEPVRIALLPEHWTGWVGRPGISGARPWTGLVAQVQHDRDCGSRTARSHRSRAGLLQLDGPTSVEVDAADPVAELELTLRLELLPGGLIRAQRRAAATSARPTTCTTACWRSRCRRWPGRCWTSAGRWGKERIPQRRPSTSAPTCGRAARAGPAPTRRPCCTSARPGFSLRRRRDLGRAHRLERQPHPLRRAAVHR